MTRVVAQGTFDILHPGHVHYLEDAAAMGEELHVIVARSVNVTHKEPPVIPDGQRREMVAALKPVDEAHLGHSKDIFVPIERIDPDVIALGYDQHHDAETLRTALRDRDIDCEIRRATPLDDVDDRLLSTGRIIDRILEQRA